METWPRSFYNAVFVTGASGSGKTACLFTPSNSSATKDNRRLKFIPRRIVITGTSGCGKTFLGRQLSDLTGYKCVDLDDLYWMPGWKKRTDDEFFSLIRKEVASDAWVVCGNYSRARQLIWPQTEMIVWLDLPLSRCLWQAFLRSVRRWIRHEPHCNGNYETLARLLGKGSLLLWIWNTHAQRKREYQQVFASTGDTRRLVRLNCKKEIQNFILACRKTCPVED